VTRPGFVTWSGLAVVLIAAAALSFNSLRLLAIACRVDPHLAALLPICVDAGAAVATRAWLSGRTSQEAERYARRMTWTLLALTVTGNATHQVMNGQGVAVWMLVVMVIVGAVPAAVMGAAVHLAVLLGRDRTPDFIPADIPAPEDVPAPPVRAGNPSPKTASVTATPDKTATKTPGRRKLAASLGISEHEARKMLANNGHKVLEDVK
jgi:hypothetical protein